MKNKKLLYILLPLASIVWGLVIYKIFSYTSEENKFAVQQNNNIQEATYNQKNDTFSLIETYKDPFLSNPYIHSDNDFYNSNETDLNPQPKKLEIIKKEPIPIPIVKPLNIKYGGVIKNQPNEKKIAIVKIDNKETLMHEGDTAHNIKLLGIYKDSIIIYYEKMKKTIIK